MQHTLQVRLALLSVSVNCLPKCLSNCAASFSGVSPAGLSAVRFFDRTVTKPHPSFSARAIASSQTSWASCALACRCACTARIASFSTGSKPPLCADTILDGFPRVALAAACVLSFTSFSSSSFPSSPTISVWDCLKDFVCRVRL
jgi:hypothetical protein